MQAILIGSAAGGGVPQWNCRCRICSLARAGDPRVSPRSQSSLAVSADGDRWVLLNASPDIREQIAATPELQAGPPPRAAALRGSPIAAVVLTNGDVDHVAGLLSLREREPFALYGSAETLRAVSANSVFDVLAHDVVTRTVCALGEAFEPIAGLIIELFPVPGKVPLWLEDESLQIGAVGESTVGASIRANGRHIVYIPGAAAVTEDILARCEGADLLLFDGTCWFDDDMIAAGVGAKTSRRMGHLPIAGVDGSIAALDQVAVGRKVFTHINNTNPVLIEGSDERRAAERAGWDIGHDGMRFAFAPQAEARPVALEETPG